MNHILLVVLLGVLGIISYGLGFAVLIAILLTVTA